MVLVRPLGQVGKGRHRPVRLARHPTGKEQSSLPDYRRGGSLKDGIPASDRARFSNRNPSAGHPLTPWFFQKMGVPKLCETSGRAASQLACRSSNPPPQRTARHLIPIHQHEPPTMTGEQPLRIPRSCRHRQRVAQSPGPSCRSNQPVGDPESLAPDDRPSRPWTPPDCPRWRETPPAFPASPLVSTPTGHPAADSKAFPACRRQTRSGKSRRATRSATTCRSAQRFSKADSCRARIRSAVWPIRKRRRRSVRETAATRCPAALAGKVAMTVTATRKLANRCFFIMIISFKLTRGARNGILAGAAQAPGQLGGVARS